MTLLVSIHDVTPAHGELIRTLYLMCTARGITPALLVVPNWHGRWPLEAFPDFVSWIRRCEDEGAEVMLHGQRHDEVGLTRTVGDEVRAFGRTAGEAEFLSLDTRSATSRICRGVELFDRVGLRPIGFVPPAWLWRESGRRAVTSVGLRVSEDDSGIDLHDRQVRFPSPVVRWSARTPLRAHTSVAVARARMATLRKSSIVRIALHPRDLTHRATALSVATTLDSAVATWTPWRYGLL